MPIHDSHSKLQSRVIDALYIEAMLLADEARSYFDNFGQLDRDHLTPLQRVSFSCESLKVTTRLMHVIAWLLSQRAIAAGEFEQRGALSSTLRLGQAAPSDEAILEALPADARALIEASAELYLRVKRLDVNAGADERAENSVQIWQKQIERAF